MRAPGPITPLLALVVASPLLGANLEVTPTSHDFGNVPAGQRKSVTIRVANEGLVIRRIPVTSSSPSFSISDANLSIPGKKSVSLVVSLSEKAPAGAVSGTITIDDGKDVVRFAVRANVQALPAPRPPAAPASPALTVTPPALDFGSVELDQSKSLTFAVTGSEPAPCTVATLSTAGYPAWQASPGSFTLAPGQPATVTVSFTVKAQLQSNDRGAGTGKITVTCGGSKAAVDLKGATPLPKRFSVTVVKPDGTRVDLGPPRPDGFAGIVAAKSTGDPQNTFGRMFGCTPGDGNPGECTGLAKAGAKVELSGKCIPDGKPFRWAAATGSAAPCQGSANPLCTFVITADTTVTPACGR